MTDFDAIEQIFKRVARQLWIVTSAAGEQRGGLVATWVSQASLNPQEPTLAIAIAVNHHTRSVIDASRAFAVHLLDEQSIDQAWRFGLQSGHDTDKFAGVDYSTEATGSPILANCLAWLDCRAFARYDGGDRVYYWADVVAGRSVREGQPLTDQALFAAADASQRSILRQGIVEDVEVQAPYLQRWRQHLADNPQPTWPA